MAPKPGERYTLRSKFFRIFGGAFHIYDADQNLVGYCDQKRFKLREDLRVYTDESKSEELLRIGTGQILDIAATYTVSVPDDDGDPETNTTICAFKRKGLKSFIRDEWLVLNPQGETIATIREDSQVSALLRRGHEIVSLLIPQRYHLNDAAGESVAVLRTHFNPFIHKLSVAVHQEHEQLDDLVLLAAGILLLAIEGRQD